MTSTITITDESSVAVIDIEGIIGTPEQLQFDNKNERIATFERFSESLAKIKQLNAKHIVVNIRSTGGSVNDALLIFDALSELDASVTTRCYGYVASAATIIAQAASPGLREISPNALYLIHCSESSAEGNSLSMAATLDMLNATDQRIASIYAAKSGRHAKNFIDLMNQNNGKGRWLSAQEALDAGLVDSIIASSTPSHLSRNQSDYRELLEVCSILGMTPPPDNYSNNSLLSHLKNLWNKLGDLFRTDPHNNLSTSDNKVCNTNETSTDMVGETCRLEEKTCKNTPQPDANTNNSELSGDVNNATDISDRISELPDNATTPPTDKTVAITIRRNAQSEAYPTTTDDIEDPYIEERIPTANEQAYWQDALSIRNRH